MILPFPAAAVEGLMKNESPCLPVIGLSWKKTFPRYILNSKAIKALNSYIVS